jgi:hypothetical protein
MLQGRWTAGCMAARHGNSKQSSFTTGLQIMHLSARWRRQGTHLDPGLVFGAVQRGLHCAQVSGVADCFVRPATHAQYAAVVGARQQHRPSQLVHLEHQLRLQGGSPLTIEERWSDHQWGD